jgi:hypothetical protein
MNRPKQRRERARLRAEERRRQAAQAGSVIKPRVAFVVSPTGARVDDPARYTAQLPPGALSDALVALMEPYVPWPPAPNELDEVEAWLELGAAAWNLCVERIGPGVAAETLPRSAQRLREMFDFGQSDPLDFVDEIVARKRRMFPNDGRAIAKVSVVAEGRNATVIVASMALVR